jgi:phage anti-repressor protein
MQNIIQIQPNTIGAEEVNSVNARDIHNYLGVKTRFDTWIDRAIKKYDFVENEDYIVMLKNEHNSNGGRKPKEYIVTLDMAKELSMLENNKKGKETRKYFIKMEKVAQQNTSLSDTNINATLIEILKNQTNQTNALIDLVKTQNAQNNVIMDFTTMVMDNMKAFSTQVAKPEVPTLQQVSYIDSRDRKKLRDAIQEKAKEVARDLGVSVSTISPSIWIELKNFFDVDDYQDILKSQVKDVMHFVMFWEPKKGQKKEVKQKVTHEIILDEDGNTRVVPIV